MTFAPETHQQLDVTAYTGPVIEFRNVSLGFEGKPLFNDISFTVASGETRILLGPAGVGKSVLLKLIDGLMLPDSGEILVFGQPVFANGAPAVESLMFALREHVGMVFQESALFDSLNVRDNVGYRLEEERVPEDEISARVLEALTFVELAHTLEKIPSELSGGMRRRVSIARAIISDPALLLYDSPTGGLDPITSTTIIDLLIKQRDVRHSTAMVVTHRLQDAFALAMNRYNTKTQTIEPIPPVGNLSGLDPATKFLVLHEGRIAFDGDTTALVTSPDPFLKEFLS
jgi:phospholipid/cholesterol/gamma-HCH transport system ATP-binding protein